MSLDNPVVLLPPDKTDPRAGVVFYDDFIGFNYDNQVWSAAGTGALANLDANGGQIRVRCNANNKDYEFYAGDMGAFSVAKNFDVEWRAALTADNGTAECGLEGAGDQATNRIRWQLDSAQANFQCLATSAGVTSTADSGVAKDNNLHLFRIIGSAGFLQFFLDGVLRAVITLNITASLLQPYAFCVRNTGSNSDVVADYVQVTGDQ